MSRHQTLLDFASAYYNARRRLRQQRGTLTKLYNAAKRANESVIYAPPVIYNADLDTHIDRIVTDRGAVDAYAAGLVLYINDVLEELRWAFNHSGVYTNTDGLSSPFPGEYNIQKVMWATANNVRHYQEWARDVASPKPCQLKSIKVIASVIGCKLLSSGANHRFGVMMAWVILEKLGTNYYEIELHARRYADEMVEALNLQDSPAVIEAAGEDCL